jgi:hypothetical protein
MSASGDGIALRRTVSDPLSESGPCDHSSLLRASAGNGNAAIGSRAPIGRAWSCRNPFGRHASFNHQRKLCGSFLAPGSRHRSQPSCGSPKARSERKDSPDRQKARGRDGRFARAKCCSAARWASSPRTPADLSGHAIILGPVSVSTNWSSERAARLRRFALLRRHGSIRSNAGSPNPPEIGSGEVFIIPSGSSRPIFALSSTGITNPKPFKWTNLHTKSWLQLSASAAKLSRPCATKFRFT